MRATFFLCLLWALGASCAVVAALAAEPAGLKPQPAAVADDAFSLIGRPNVCVIDARPSLFYRRGHIPGAVNLSRVRFAADWGVSAAIMRADGIDTWVVYCSDRHCDDSHEVAELLRAQGLGRVLVFTGGWEEWLGLGGTVETGKL